MGQRPGHPLVEGRHDGVDDAGHKGPNEKETDDGIDKDWFQTFKGLRQSAYEFL